MSAYADIRAPYPGLRAFRRQESPVFFGREEQIDELLERLTGTRLLAVTGESGCGKSSLIRAGMIPALEAGFMPRTNAHWHIAEMRPEHRPIQNLAACLLSAISKNDSPTSAEVGLMVARLRQGPLGIVQLLRDCPLPAGDELLLLVDQFEEIIRFRDRTNADEAVAFVALLLETINDGSAPVRIVLTLRTDYLGKCALFRGLPEALTRSQYLTPLLSREQLLDAIVSPARVLGGDVDAVLANHLINEIGRTQDQLPVIQHALMWMWSKACSRRPAEAQAGTTSQVADAHPVDPRAVTLTMRDYEGLNGLGAALSSHADFVYESLGSDEKRRIARRLFCALWDNEGKGGDNRRHCQVDVAAEIAGTTTEGLTEVADAFRSADHSFIMPLAEDRRLQANDVLDVSHESLFRHWGQLKAWTQEELKDGDELRNLFGLACDWEAKRGNLLPGKNLDTALAWQRRVRPTKPWAGRYLAQASDLSLALQFVQKSARSHRRRRAWEIVGLAGILGVMFVAAIFYVRLQARNEANSELRARGERDRLASAASSAAMSEPLRSLQLGVEAALGPDGVALPANVEAGLHLALRRSHFRGMLVASRGAFGAADFVTNEKIVTVGAGDGAALWNRDTGSRLWAAWGGDSVPTCLAVNRHGRTIATAGGSGTVDLWNSETGGHLATLQGQVGEVNAVSFSPDGTLLASAGEDGTAWVWDTSHRRVRWTLVDHAGPVEKLAFSHDSRLLVTSGHDGNVNLWDTRTGSKVRTMFGSKTASAGDIAFNSTGGLLAITSGSSAYLFDPITTRRLGEFEHTNMVLSLAFSPDGRKLGSASFDGRLKIWDVAKRSELASIAEEALLRIPAGESRARRDVISSGSGWLNKVAFSPDGNQIVTTGLDGTAKIWSAFEGGEEGHFFAHEGGVARLAFSPDGKRVATSGWDPIVRVWEASPAHPLAAERIVSGGAALAYDSTGARLAVAGERSVTLYDAATMKMVGEPLVVGPGEAEAVAFLHRHDWLVLGGGKTASAWDIASWKKRWQVDTGPTDLSAVAVSPDDELVATECIEGQDDDTSHSVCLWDASAGTKLRVLGQVAVSRDAGVEADGGADGGVEDDRETPSHFLRIMNLAFSPDGKYLASASKDKTVMVWDVASGALVTTLLGHRESVTGLAWSPDSKLLATSGNDWVRVWNAARWIPEERFPDANPGAVWIAFSIDGKGLAAGGSDGVVRIYAMDPATLVRLASTRLPFVMASKECERYGRATCRSEPTSLQMVNSGRVALRGGAHDRGLGLLQKASGGTSQTTPAEALRFEAAKIIERARGAMRRPVMAAILRMAAYHDLSVDLIHEAFAADVRDAIAKSVQLGRPLLENAIQIDPSLHVDPVRFAHSIASNLIFELARMLADRGIRDDVLAEFLRPLSSDESHSVTVEAQAKALGLSRLFSAAIDKLRDRNPDEAVRTLVLRAPPATDPRFSIWWQLVLRAAGEASLPAKAILSIARNPPKGSLDVNLAAAAIFWTTKAWKDMATAAQRVLAVEPGNSHALLMLGVSRYNTHQFKEALAALKDIPATSFEYHDAAAIAGATAFDRLNDRKEGYRLMAASAEGRDTSRWANLAEAALATGRFLEAELIAQRVLEGHETDPARPDESLAMHFVRVAAQAESGDFEGAKARLESLFTSIGGRDQKEGWSYRGSRVTANGIQEPLLRHFVLQLIDFADSGGKRSSPDELRRLIAKAERAQTSPSRKQ